jgi:hypothetical protein
MDSPKTNVYGEYRRVSCRATVKMRLLAPSAPGPLGRATRHPPKGGCGGPPARIFFVKLFVTGPLPLRMLT